jgi:hypothetical protein
MPRGQKWTPAQKAKFRETMAAKKAERGLAAVPPTSPQGLLRLAKARPARASLASLELSLTERKLAAVERMLTLFERIMGDDDA